MTRPAHVRCENCCYWKFREKAEDRSPAPTVEGRCRRYPPRGIEHAGADWYFPVVWNDMACGEFRAEWPGVERPVHVHLACDNEGTQWRWWMTREPKKEDAPST